MKRFLIHRNGKIISRIVGTEEWFSPEAIQLVEALFIYARTLLKLLMGKDALAKRILPDYSPPAAASIFQ